MTTLRVAPSARSRRGGDEATEVDPTRVAVEPWGRGRAVVHTDDGDTWAFIGSDRPATPDRPRTVEVVVDGWRFELEVEDARRSALRARATRDRDDPGTGGPLEVRAVIPGRVVSVAVAPGDVVEAGRTLLVVEAMKMQNELRAPRAGRVERIVVAAGDTIELNQPLVVLA